MTSQLRSSGRLWVYFYLLFLFVVSVLPLKSDLPECLSWDKIAHVFLYFILAVMIVKISLVNNKKFGFLSAFIYSSCLGLLIEVIQFFLPYRSFESLDILANSLGSFMGVIIYRLIFIKFKFFSTA
ncbi:MAG: VanZ family protein [Candidatus Omnitrophica bacterium]|nr:VanZ family protein [Candidatus Omnitrophota bacterium]